MPNNTCTGAMMTCSFGAAPSTFNPTPKQVNTNFVVAANITDFVPIQNVPPFGPCSAPSNPAVIAATSAALGVPTPAPCVPALPSPWKPGATTVKICGTPALNNTSTLNCAWMGVITFTNPGQTTHNIP